MVVVAWAPIFPLGSRLLAMAASRVAAAVGVAVAALAVLATAQCNHTAIDPDTGVELLFQNLTLIKCGGARARRRDPNPESS